MNSQDQCPLFKLPAELRLHIYKHCLTANAPIVDAEHSVSHESDNQGELTNLAEEASQRSDTSDDASEFRHSPALERALFRNIPALGTALLRTCRVLHAEMDVRPLYSLNEFSFTDPGIVNDFLTGVSAQYRHCITALTFDCRAAVTANDSGTYDDYDVLYVWGQYFDDPLKVAIAHGEVTGPHMQELLG